MRRLLFIFLLLPALVSANEDIKCAFSENERLEALMKMKAPAIDYYSAYQSFEEFKSSYTKKHPELSNDSIYFLYNEIPELIEYAPAIAGSCINGELENKCTTSSICVVSLFEEKAFCETKRNICLMLKH